MTVTHGSLPSAAIINRIIACIPESRPSVNRTLTEPLTPNSDSGLSAHAQIIQDVERVEPSKDRNMITLPRSAIVARGPSFLALERMSWSPVSEEASKTKKEHKEVEAVGPRMIH